MAFPKEFLDIIRDRLSVSDIVSKKVKLSKSGRNFLGLCPFHHEKTPSFTVNDDKGFYHCFGCGAHGDVITFEMQINNYSFFEAVESLASQVGLEMPKATEEEQQQAKRYASLYDIMEKACNFFIDKLNSDDGKQALEYLKIKRNLSDEIIHRFKIGFAPSGNKLLKFLDNNHIEIKDMMELGLVQKSEKDGSIYDFFRNRVIFPIQDSRGRIIAFGGRVLDDSLPKYINSSESPLFKKNKVLYGLAQARETTYTDKRIIAVEGYVDVIALVSAGINSAVAPLGTSITDSHLQILWKLNDKPILCFDGDGAGRKAAVRASFLSLPLLKAGKSLQIAILPDGDDPDDLIKKGGREAVEKVLSSAQPLIDIIWKSLLDKIQIDTPEDKAKLELEIEEVCKQITDISISKFYKKELQNRMWNTFKNVKTSASKSSNIKGKNRFGFFEPLKTQKLNNQIIIQNSPDSIFNLLAHIICFPELLNSYFESEHLFKTEDDKINKFISKIFSIIFDNPEINRQDLIDELRKNDFGHYIKEMSSKIELYQMLKPENVKHEFELFIKTKEKNLIDEELKTETDPERIETLREEKKRMEEYILRLKNF